MVRWQPAHASRPEGVLAVTVAGSGDVDDCGSPTLTRSVGSGTVKRLGSAPGSNVCPHAIDQGAHITTMSSPSPSATQPLPTISSRTARSIV